MGLLVATAVFGFAEAHAHNPFDLILVDKNKNQIHLAAYTDDHIQIKKTFHVTLGKIKGDKEVEKDLKTPEGVYFFTTKLKQPGLKKKFGAMAFKLNYPNPMDELGGKTGYDIMLHATDAPTRLQKDYDSEGCVVVSDAEISELAQSIRLGITPIIIYPELKPNYLQGNANPEVRQAFDQWLKAWNSKDIDTYVASYANAFSHGKMNLKQYREYKKSLNQRYAEINVKAEHLRYFFHPKYDVVSFTQIYESRLKSGGQGFKSAGTKVLYFVKEGDRHKIADESYSGLLED